MEIEEFVESVIDQAKYLFDKAGEFYPFGAGLNTADEIVPIGVFLENDFPAVQEVVDILEKAIITQLVEGHVSVAGICTDVFFRPIGEIEKKSAFHIRTLGADAESKDFYLPYRIEGETTVYENIFSEKGTLTFLKVDA